MGYQSSSRADLESILKKELPSHLKTFEEADEIALQRDAQNLGTSDPFTFAFERRTQELRQKQETKGSMMLGSCLGHAQMLQLTLLLLIVNGSIALMRMETGERLVDDLAHSGPIVALQHIVPDGKPSTVEKLLPCVARKPGERGGTSHPRERMVLSKCGIRAHLNF